MTGPLLPTTRTVAAGPWKGPCREVRRPQPVEPPLRLLAEEQRDDERLHYN